ncbi:PREDICTED: uncharacterized protein LOC105568152 [Vollenhovia emeryi]|uniref:uncharacterized protein LOC105568152 n=1 Tax=Vollenhovia emeryi TaxID=411798 RepID=UPI0005F3FF25|nr:PREDICTED: uncharacterized protein LOC105568152 [Vollenhovia emeryi]
MPINKFGISLGRSGTDSYYQYSGLIRNYVRDNALCVVATDFDAKSCKIRRVALPVDDDDAVNKRGYHYILTVIDVLSKHAWVVPLKAKSGCEVTAAIAKIIRVDGRCPKNLQTGNGKEFYNANVQKLLKKHNINHYSTYSVMKASVVERFNRTLKNDMWKMFTLNGNYRWIDALSRLVSDYNARKHRTIGYAPNWSTEVFKIGKVQKTNPVTYILEDSCGKPIAGGFYEHELHCVANPDVYLVEKVLRKRGNEVYVKWLGLDKSHNSWICTDNVL